MPVFPDHDAAASDIDLDRVVIDAAYRRQVMERLRRERRSAHPQPATVDIAVAPRGSGL